MAVFYILGVLVLGVAKLLLDRRVRRLENRYTRIALQTETLAHDGKLRGGTNQAPDACEIAKRQYHLAQLAMERDDLEARYYVWQFRADRVGKLRSKLTSWKGRFAPYLLGAIDVAVILVVLHLTGAAELLNLDSIREMASIQFEE
jgi:hypothetical protein